MIVGFKGDCQDNFDALGFADTPEMEKCPHTYSLVGVFRILFRVVFQRKISARWPISEFLGSKKKGPDLLIRGLSGCW
jgi:hypothetical protein